MNILLVSHGKLCEGVLDAYKMLFADAPNVSALGLTTDGVEDFRMRLDERLAALDGQGPILVMADLLGGTPYNEAYARLLEDPSRLRLVCGLNLPMLIEAGVMASATDDIDAVVQTAVSAGASGVCGAELPQEDGPEEEEDLF